MTDRPQGICGVGLGHPRSLQRWEAMSAGSKVNALGERAETLQPCRETPKGFKYLRRIPGAGAATERYPEWRLQKWTPQSETTHMNRIRAARQALGWTQNELARKANVSPRTIHAVEKGRACRQATKRHILNALGVPWELRNEYFVHALSVRRISPAMEEEAQRA